MRGNAHHLVFYKSLIGYLCNYRIGNYKKLSGCYWMVPGTLAVEVQSVNMRFRLQKDNICCSFFKTNIGFKEGIANF